MTQYPRLSDLGLEVKTLPGRLDYVESEPLREALEGAGINKWFSQLFGVQTCPIEGVYAHDAEAVLERIHSGRRTGTQLHWD